MTFFLRKDKELIKKGRNKYQNNASCTCHSLHVKGEVRQLGPTRRSVPGWGVGQHSIAWNPVNNNIQTYKQTKKQMKGLDS